MYHDTYLRLSKHDTMHSVKEQYRDINPVTVNVIEANVTSSLYCGAVHGLDAPGADLVEAFLVELYRCRVCQFTSSLKSSIKTHLLDSHDDLPPAMASSGFEEEEPVVMEHIAPRAPDSPYHLEHELTSDSKHSDDDPMDHMGLDRMSFLLPMYGILPSMSPRSCDMGMSSNCDGGLQVAETCEVSTLFEDQDDEAEEEGADGEEPTIFQLKASCPLVRPPNQLDDQLAQSAHLMTLGLCRISKTPKVSTPPEQVPASVLDDKEPQPVPADPLGSRGLAGQQGVKAEERPASGGCRRCGRRMRGQGKTKSGKMQSCRACQRSDRTRRSGDTRTPHRHSPDPHTATAQSTKAAVEHNMHSPNAQRASKGKRHTSSIQSSGTHTEGTRRDRTWTDHTRTPKAYACSRDAWLSGVFCDYKDTTEEEIDRRLSSRQTDTPPSSHQPTSRGRSHKGAESTHPHRTRKQSRSPEGNTGLKKKAPKGTIVRRDLCCLLCDRKFCSRLTLRRHMGIHQGSKPYSCQLCPYRSRLKASLLQHNRIHTGEKPFQCPDPGCSYASIDRSSLLRHSRTHTQQKPYHCQHCSYSCIQKKCLDLHARRHHTGESFPCQQCPYSSPDRQLLLRHVQRHHLPLAALP